VNQRFRERDPQTVVICLIHHRIIEKIMRRITLILQAFVSTLLPHFQCAYCFQQPTLSRINRKEFSCSPSGLDAKFKFRLDNDEDDEQQRVDVYDTPRVTFGAEAVPEDQRPANEYLDLISAPLFDWADENAGSKGLLLRLGGLYTVCFGAVCWPISGATFTGDGFLWHKLCSSNVGALGVILFLLIRLYTGWGYIGSRLTSKTIEYEETGWYDGEIEPKTKDEIARDLLLFRANVKPVKERLKFFTLTAGGLWLASCVALNLVYSAKPVFNEYDADMLKRLSNDEKVANVAAQQSNGRPTYCDSRYYRAVAGGGQGCN